VKYFAVEHLFANWRKKETKKGFSPVSSEPAVGTPFVAEVKHTWSISFPTPCMLRTLNNYLIKQLMMLTINDIMVVKCLLTV